MAGKRAAKLKVITSGLHSRIEVPSVRALALHEYLRSFGLPTSPPEPRCTGMDNIVLGRGLDTKAVQALLDKWV